MEYKNFDLEAFEYEEEDGGTRSFKVRVQSAPEYGEQGLKDAASVSLPANLNNRLRSLEKRNLASGEIIELGRALAEMLFPGDVQNLFETNLALVENAGNRLRIRLKLDDFRLADIPWEYVYLPEPVGFLTLDARISLVRYEMMKALLGSVTHTEPGPLRIAILLADPKPEPHDAHPKYPPLGLDEEEKQIRDALVKVRGRGVQDTFYPDATSADVLWACDSHILHFAGHGDFETEQSSVFGVMEGRGSLILLDEEQKPAPYSVDKLKVIMKGKQVRLAVLGACKTGRRDHINAWTGIAPALAQVGIPAVVGMQYTIRNKSAILFSWIFYHALAENKPIDEAVTLGRQAIFNDCGPEERSWRDWGVPVLYFRTDVAEDGRLFPLASISSNGGSKPPTGDLVTKPTPIVAGSQETAGSPDMLPPGQCLGCGAYVSAKFCPNCGTQLARCLNPECRTPLPANAKFCVECGTPVIEE